MGLQWLVLIQCQCPVISPKLENSFPLHIHTHTHTRVCVCVCVYIYIYMKVTQSCLTLPLSMNSPSKNTVVGCHFLLQGILPTQRSNPGLLHCRPIFYCLSHQESSYIIYKCTLIYTYIHISI